MLYDPHEPMELGEQLRAVRSGRSVELDLQEHIIGEELSEIPTEVLSLERLQKLILQGQDIRVIPDSIRNLPNLELLDLRGTLVNEVPNVKGLMLDWPTYCASRAKISPENIIGLAVSLGEDQSNLVSVREIERLPKELRRLPNLVSLRIGTDVVVISVGDKPGAPLPDPPQEIVPAIEMLEELVSLRELTLVGVAFRKLPTGLRALKELEYLYISGVSELPIWLPELAKLKVAAFQNCELRELPNVLFDLKQLQHLSLNVWHDGAIRTIPETILNLPNLKNLELKGHPIETPPPEVAANGVEAIKDYWRQRQDVGIDYLCEAKVLIVGEGGAGKTSLARKLVNPSYKLRQEEASTEGISIGQWSFPFGLRVREDKAEEIRPQTFTANLWDFGGQEIYHATHQFFLSRRSLYLLVTDDRKEDTDFNYWLQLVELLGGDSPLLIVQNEKQNRRRDIDLLTLRSRFSNLKQTHSVNLADNRGLENLQTAIRNELENLPHIGTALPRTWISVRQALEADSRCYIKLDEYFTICDHHGFKKLDDKLQLSGYLHDLGICLHFQNDPQLKNILFLDPNWATDAVYRVLDDEGIATTHGRFDHNDLRPVEIWDSISSLIVIQARDGTICTD